MINNVFLKALCLGFFYVINNLHVFHLLHRHQMDYLLHNKWTTNCFFEGRYIFTKSPQPNQINQIKRWNKECDFITIRPCLTFSCGGDETEWPAVCDSKNVNTASRDRSIPADTAGSQSVAPGWWGALTVRRGWGLSSRCWRLPKSVVISIKNGEC